MPVGFARLRAECTWVRGECDGVSRSMRDVLVHRARSPQTGRVLYASPCQAALTDVCILLVCVQAEICQRATGEPPRR